MPGIVEDQAGLAAGWAGTVTERQPRDWLLHSARCRVITARELVKRLEQCCDAHTRLLTKTPARLEIPGSTEPTVNHLAVRMLTLGAGFPMKIHGRAPLRLSLW